MKALLFLAVVGTLETMMNLHVSSENRFLSNFPLLNHNE